MSVAIPIIDSIDGVNRLIYLKAGVSDYFPIEDLYHEYRYLRRTDEALRKWEPLLKADGNIPKGGGRFTPRYVTLLDGTKIVPFNEILQINQLGEIITDNPDVDATIYDVSGLTVAKPIFIQPSEAEIINLDSEEIKNQSYLGGKVFINTTLGTPSGIGTPTDPVDSYANALVIANTRNLNAFDITGAVALTASDDVVSKRFYSATPVNASITLTNVDISSAYFERINISGSCSASETSPASFSECFLGAITNFWGSTKDCIFYDDITQHSGATGIMIHDNARSGVGGDRRFTYDYNTAPADVMWRNYVGGQTLANITQGFHSMDGMAMRIEVLSSCTGGEIVIGGTGRVTNNNNGTSVLTDSGVQDLIWNKTLP